MKHYKKKSDIIIKIEIYFYQLKNNDTIYYNYIDYNYAYIIIFFNIIITTTILSIC